MPLREEARERQNTDENLPVLARPEEEVENHGHLDSDSEARPLTPPVEHTHSEVRRSTCDRKPRQILT